MKLFGRSSLDTYGLPVPLYPRSSMFFSRDLQLSITRIGAEMCLFASFT